MDQSILNFLASGGVSGFITGLVYMVYKICIKKKCRSKCYGAEMEMKNDLPSSKDSKSNVLLDV